jgi:hypothetical protein
MGPKSSRNKKPITGMEANPIFQPRRGLSRSFNPLDDIEIADDVNESGALFRLCPLVANKENSGPLTIAPTDARVLASSSTTTHTRAHIFASARSNGAFLFASLLPTDVLGCVFACLPLLSRQRMRMLCTCLWVRLTALVPEFDLLQIDSVTDLTQTESDNYHDHEWPDLVVTMRLVRKELAKHPTMQYGALIDYLPPTQTPKCVSHSLLIRHIPSIPFVSLLTC